MTKSKKKKNYKLRRRIKRTIASITMVMAVVVASIPVENYGTMQAADDDEVFDMAAKYAEDKDSSYFDLIYDGSKYAEDSYTDNNIIIQQIHNGSLKRAYKVKDNGDRAIVNGVGELSDITINDTEFYNYVMFDANYIDAIHAAIGTEISVTYENNGNVKYDEAETEVVVDNGTTTYKLPAFNLNYLKTEPIGIDIALTDITNANSQGYDDAISDINTYELISECEPNALEEKNNEIVEYNTDVKNVEDAKAIIEAFKKPTDTADPNQYPSITQEQYDSWIELTKGSFDITSLSKLTIPYDELSLNGKLPLAVEYIICNRYANGGKKLDKFELIESDYKINASDANSSTVYLAKKKAGENIDNTYLVDGNELLAANSINVVGIASNSFKDVDTIQNVVLSYSVKFIGSNAFENCQTLNSVKVNYDSVEGGCEEIGDYAFANSTLASLTFSDTTSTSKLKKLGVRALKNTNITNIDLPASVANVGAGCFEDAGKLVNVSFKSGGTNPTKIGAYAFYNNVALKNVAFEDTARQYEILRGAFSLPAETNNVLESFSFPIGNAKINYDSNDKTGEAYDYILAGRSALKTVVFGEQLNDTIPDNILRGCYNLKEAYFNSATTKFNTYDKDTKEIHKPQLFSDVTEVSFSAYGPQKKADNTTDADPLVSSWTGYLGFETDGKPAPVPYQYTDAEGNTHIELGYNSGEYIATVDVIDGSNAVLANYKLNPKVVASDTRTPVTIPAKIGNYNIVEIGENCFDKSVKDKIFRIIIEDGHVVSIGAGAFSGCKNLEWVYIGNSVHTINSKAFADCTALENIVFSHIGKVNYRGNGIDYVIGDDDETWANELVIPESDAFATKSEHLTFHGAVHSGYAPFEIAMSDNNSSLLSSGAQICYKTDEPLNLTVIRNRGNGKATLVDYPHYQEIDDINREYIKEQHGASADSYSIIGEFESKCVNSDVGMDKENEKAIVEASLNIELPRGIQSIDSKAFYSGEKNDRGEMIYSADINLADFWYVKNYYSYNADNESKKSNFESNRIYEYKTITSNIRSEDGGNQDIAKIYSINGYIEDSDYASVYGETEDAKVAIGGLFSGYYNDNNKVVSSKIVEQYELNSDGSSGLMDNTYNNHKYEENFDSGNDYITTVNMATVDALPAYAFDSNENLLTAAFGNDLSSIGVLPFRDCKNLYDVYLGTNNQNYTFANMMLFRNNGDGTTYTLIECLEGRGKGEKYLSANMLADEFISDVTDIEDGAFSNCNEIKVVDLSKTKVTEIPVDCFKNSNRLSSVVLPNTIRQIDTGALCGVADAISITVPTSDCVITAGAIDGKSHLTIIGSKYKTDGETLSDLWHSYQTLVKDYGQDMVSFTDYGNSYKIEFVDKDLNTIPGYSYVVEIKEEDKPYNLNAQQIPTSAPQITGYDFVAWMCRVNGEVLTGTKPGDDAFNNISEDRLFYPSYKANPSSVVSDGIYKFEFENATATFVSGTDGITTGTQLTSGQELEGGSTVTLISNDESKFQYWSVEATTQGDDNNYTTMISNTNKHITTFTMPNAAVKVIAHLSTDGSGGNGTGGNGSGGNGTGGNGSGGTDGSGNGSTDGITKYKVTVNYGSGSGEYKAGDTVSISAFAPESANKVFSKWTSNNSSLGFVSATASTTTFVMPAADITVTANYKTRSDDDDDDDDTPSRRPGTNTTTTTVTNRPSNSTTTGTTGTVTSTTTTTKPSSTIDNDGSKIYITKNGVSNKDVASVSVSGSTDNFIVRITESAEATAAVEESLMNKYGSLDGLSYFPMDISLYDSTGQNKITDTYGLNITVTMPIPDVLIQYGGNARVAAADNGNLQQLTPRFTTIDGIACISFVPPHFSPYVIYVDTNNLIAGQTLDSTPSTGDPIHPKWFAAIGMACISIILFVTSDGRKRRNYKTA